MDPSARLPALLLPLPAGRPYPALPLLQLESDSVVLAIDGVRPVLRVLAQRVAPRLAVDPLDPRAADAADASRLALPPAEAELSRARLAVVSSQLVESLASLAGLTQRLLADAGHAGRSRVRRLHRPVAPRRIAILLGGRGVEGRVCNAGAVSDRGKGMIYLSARTPLQGDSRVRADGAAEGGAMRGARGVPVWRAADRSGVVRGAGELSRDCEW